MCKPGQGAATGKRLQEAAAQSETWQGRQARGTHRSFVCPEESRSSRLTAPWDWGRYGRGHGNLGLTERGEVRVHLAHHGVTGIHLLHRRAPDPKKKQFGANTAELNGKRGSSSNAALSVGAQTLRRSPSGAHNPPGRNQGLNSAPNPSSRSCHFSRKSIKEEEELSRRRRREEGGGTLPAPKGRIRQPARPAG